MAIVEHGIGHIGSRMRLRCSNQEPLGCAGNIHEIGCVRPNPHPLSWAAIIDYLAIQAPDFGDMVIGRCMFSDNGGCFVLWLESIINICACWFCIFPAKHLL